MDIDTAPIGCVDSCLVTLVLKQEELVVHNYTAVHKILLCATQHGKP